MDKLCVCCGVTILLTLEGLAQETTPPAVSFGIGLLPEEIIPELYEKYREAVEDDETEVSHRRFFRNDREYEIHVQKLKDVNGYKLHNLRIGEKNKLGDTLVYVSNPIESKLPNAYLTLEEFKHSLMVRAAKDRQLGSNNEKFTIFQYVTTPKKYTSSILIPTRTEATIHIKKVNKHAIEYETQPVTKLDATRLRYKTSSKRGLKSDNKSVKRSKQQKKNNTKNKLRKNKKRGEKEDKGQAKINDTTYKGVEESLPIEYEEKPMAQSANDGEVATEETTTETEDTTKVPNDTTISSEFPEGAEILSDVPGNAAITSNVTDEAVITSNVTDEAAMTSDVIHEAKKASDVSDETTTVSDVPDDAAITSDVTDEAAMTSDFTDETTTVSDVSDEAAITSDVTDEAEITSDVFDEADKASDDPDVTTIASNGPGETVVASDDTTAVSDDMTVASDDAVVASEDKTIVSEEPPAEEAANRNTEEAQPTELTTARSTRRTLSRPAVFMGGY